MIYSKNNLPKHVVFHSPDGFNWGYGGSGPSELARCLCLEVLGKDKGKSWHYQDFKNKYVSNWDNNWEISTEEIKQWANQMENKNEN